MPVVRASQVKGKAVKEAAVEALGPVPSWAVCICQRENWIQVGSRTTRLIQQKAVRPPNGRPLFPPNKA